MFLRLAARNLVRNRWRSFLTAGGVAVATALLIWTVCFSETFSVAMVKGATAVDVGQAQIHSAAYVKKASLYHTLTLDEAQLGAIRRVEGVAGASPRAQVYGLVGNESRSQVARILGIDSVNERAITNLSKGVVKGRWLSDQAPQDGAREVLLGKDLARLLGVGPGDELVVFIQAADGSLGNDVLSVVGLVQSGNTAVDRATVLMHLSDVQMLAALEGVAHEITLSVTRFEEAEQVVGAVQAVLAKDNTSAAPEDRLVVRTWKEVLPQLAQMIETSEKSIWIIYFIIYLLAALGILNTQRMSAMERRREFGVLLALGVKPRSLGAMLVTEAVFLSMLGGVIGAALGWGVSAYFAEYGLNMAALSDSGSFKYMGVSFDDQFYFIVDMGGILEQLVWVAGVGMLCGLWPAWSSARLNAVQAIAGRT